MWLSNFYELTGTITHRFLIKLFQKRIFITAFYLGQDILTWLKLELYVGLYLSLLFSSSILEDDFISVFIFQVFVYQTKKKKEKTI